MTKNILIIDDEVEFTRLLENYFRTKAEYKIFSACDGKVALDLIQEQNPSLVLLDMKLPTVNGPEILKILRQQYPQCKVIVMTAYDIEYKREIDAIGYDAFFLKPIPFQELKDKVKELLTQSTSSLAPKIEERPLSKESPTIKDKAKFIPTARIVIIEPRDPTALLLKGYLENTVSDCKFDVLTLRFGPAYFNEIEKFEPDIVLYDTITMGHFPEFSSRLMNLPKPAKEIILFGDPKSKWDEVDILVKRGMHYISMPLIPISERLPESFENLAPAKETVERLLNTIKEACFKHGLVEKK